MTDWFKAKFVSRAEHDEVVAYYRRLVANLQHTICELRTRADEDMFSDMLKHSVPTTERKAGAADDNVIFADFRRKLR